MFGINQKVVYPGHGVAVIQCILERCLAGNVVYFYELKFIDKDMTILVPVDNILSVGVRELSSSQTIANLYRLLAERELKTSLNDMSASSWNKRSKKYQFLLRTGDLLEIARIYRDLSLIGFHKEHSFGERSLLMQTEHLLAQEIALIENRPEDVVAQTLRSYCLHVPSTSHHRQATL